MADAGIDVLMAVFNKGRAMQAESRTVMVVDKTIDQMRQGFEPGQFCELQEFSFSAGVGGSLSDKTKKAQKKADKAGALKEDTKIPPTPGERASALRASQLEKAGKHKTVEYVDMQPVEFTRVFDTSSTLLFQALTGCDTLDSIAVVKRKAAGTSNSGECYLRLDFTKVLITDLGWKDGEHVIIETGTFIYREVRIRYRPQQANGSLGTVIESKWAMKRAS